MAPSRARGRFQADLELTPQRNISHVSHIRKGDAEDEIIFVFDHPHLPPPHSIEIRVMPQDISEYPDGNLYLVYTNDNVPGGVAKELEESMVKTAGMRIGDVVNDLSRRLRVSLKSGNDADSVMTDAETDEPHADDWDESDDDVPSDLDAYDDDFGLATDNHGTGDSRSMKVVPPSTLNRIRNDLCAIRDAGFKVGKLCGLDQATEYSIVSTSVRVNKLCLSDETREAWNITSSDYIVLLIQYVGNYATFEDVISRPAEQSRLKFRLRKCSKYRPTLPQAIAALSADSKKAPPTNAPQSPASDDREFSLLGIGESIDMLLDNDFVPMLKLRRKEGVAWDSAKKLHSSMIKSLPSGQLSSEDPKTSPHEGSEPGDETKLPPFLANDHLLSDGEISLPLIATQFALRYLVRCTDYCMICHEKVEGNFEALKPYVCGNSLCLFQYMSLGFGPSIDHEIINQPYVVDLLISFCYASLHASDHTGNSKMREFPTGLSLRVPDIRRTAPPQTMPGVHQGTGSPVPSLIPIAGASLADAVEVLFDWEDSTVTPTSPDACQDWTEGRWVVVSTPHHHPNMAIGQSQNVVLHHARIERKIGPIFHLHVAARHTMPLGSDTNEIYTKASAGKNAIKGHLLVCDQNLDRLDEGNKAFSMMIILATLPSVAEMRTYLLSSQSRQLATWDRMNPAAMGLLRWIVASNRSYIVQVDKCPSVEGHLVSDKLVRGHERISGVDGWIQFRFAQGSPEKEALFQEALKDVKKPQRTLVAWHGSPLGNWHSIIRQGLDYTVASHGRAFGDGVYFSRDFDYSLSYSNMGSFSYSQGNANQSLTWPQSALKINNAISLNELVNLPEKFRHSSQCFVVQQCHWIQCRFLFVRPNMILDHKVAGQQHTSRNGTSEFVQDPKWPTTGPGRKQLYIPKIAIPSAQDKPKPSSMAWQTDGGGSLAESEDEDDEDVAFLFRDIDDAKTTPTADTRPSWNHRPHSMESDYINGLPPTPTQQELQTDFRPGTLDFSTLPQLAPPSYATEIAQKTIARELKSLQKIQSTTPPHELGWFIDFEKINNMFQWIVELHSFDPGLPLAKDMKKADATSIVLEIRFLREFPISPPFVRVIRPRFLPFQSGGGGHVTAGGAMCMELLTNTGWSPVSSLESVLLQVRMAISSLDRPARLETARSIRDYGVAEAVDAYTRAAQVHGWSVPKDLQEGITQMIDSRSVPSGST